MIYFIQAADGTGPIKIGYTMNLDQRLASLQNTVKKSLKVLCTLQGNKKDEKALHDYFSELHENGEWFKVDRKLLQFIEQPGTYLPGITEFTNTNLEITIPPKRHTTIRFSPTTDAQIAELRQRTGIDQAEVILLAVDRFYREETKQAKAKAANEAAERELTND